MSFEPIAAIAAAPGSSAAATLPTEASSVPPSLPPYAVVSTNVTPIMPPGYTQTQTIKADGVETTVITNATGGTVDTIYGTATLDPDPAEVSVWA